MRENERIKWTYSMLSELDKLNTLYPHDPARIAEEMGIKKSIIVNTIERYFRPETKLYQRRKENRARKVC